jgi:hypothetical protein
MSDMDLVLLESVKRDAILASTWAVWHRRIPVIDESAIAPAGCGDRV